MSDISKIKEILKKHELRISELESKVNSGEVENFSFESSKQIPDDVLRLIGKHLDEIKTFELIVLILKFHGELNREKQIEILKKLGKKEADSMRSGNYNRDIVNKGLVHRDKIGKEGKYGLTARGKSMADTILEKLKEKN